MDIDSDGAQTCAVIKWLMTGAAAAAVVLGGATSVTAAQPQISITNMCASVLVTASNAPTGSDVRISRNGKPAGGFVYSGAFSVAAHQGLTVGVSINGSPEATHTYSDPDNCSSTALSADFNDFCFDQVYVQLLDGTQHAKAPGFIVTVNGTRHDVPVGRPYHIADAVPADAVIGVYRELPGGIQAFYANHVYRKPVGCGTVGLTTRFIDHCNGVRAEVTSTASAIQTWSAFHGQTVQRSPWAMGNAMTVQQIGPLAEGEIVTLKLSLPSDGYEEFATHTYHKPAICDGSPYLTPFLTTATFVDSCAATAVTITNFGDVREYWIIVGGQRDFLFLGSGESRTVEVRGATVTVSAGGQMEGNPDRTIATHTYAKPAGCGGLPVTGRATVVIAAAGLLAVLLGIASLLLARRRRVAR